MVVEFCESNKSVDGIAVDAGPFVPGSTLDCFTVHRCLQEGGVLPIMV